MSPLEKKVIELLREREQFEQEREHFEQEREQLEQQCGQLEQRHKHLEQESGQLQQERDELERERDEYRKLYELSREECDRLRRGLLGQKAERLPSDVKQLSLHMLGLALKNRGDGDDEDEEVEKQEVRGHTRRKPTGRKPLPDNLPVVRIVMRPPDVEKQGLDAFEKIGEEVSEVLERRPQSLVKVQVVREKYVPKDRDKMGPTEVLISEPPELPIEKGLAGPGMLADTIVRRWDDHTPLNRLERVYGREGIILARSTMCGWHEQLVPLVRRVVEAMFEDAFNAPYLCTDATGVLVQAKEKCRKGHFWVLVVPERHVLFRFSHRHDSQAVDDLLKGYEGYLVADAHVVFDHLYVDGNVVEVGCWGHGRRYWFKTLPSDPERAKIALGLMVKLFRIERTIAGSPRKKKEKARQKQSKPIVDRYFEWCEEQAEQVLDDSPAGEAVQYSLNQEMALRRFIDDGRLPMTNNVSERELRRQAVGRKNWIFVGSEDGAEANVTFVSLLASCRMHTIEPWSYLRDLLCLLPGWPTRRVLELAPVNWQKTLEDEETQRRLEANPFRQITMPSDVHGRRS